MPSMRVEKSRDTVPGPLVLPGVDGHGHGEQVQHEDQRPLQEHPLQIRVLLRNHQ